MLVRQLSRQQLLSALNTISAYMYSYFMPNHEWALLSGCFPRLVCCKDRSQISSLCEKKALIKNTSPPSEVTLRLGMHGSRGRPICHLCLEQDKEIGSLTKKETWRHETRAMSTDYIPSRPC
jgi:hypothetical protein